MKNACLNLLLAAGIALPLSASAQETVALEAESGRVTPPFVVTNGYIFQALGTNLAASGRGVYDFSISEPGDFVILATVSSPGHASSLVVNVDAEPTVPTMIWDIPPSQGFTNRIVTWREDGSSTNATPRRMVFSLPPGPHQIIIRGGGDAGARLDRFIIARLPAPPSDLRVEPAGPP